MKEVLYSIIRIPSILINFINLHLYGVKYKRIKINGIIRFHGNGKFVIGDNVEINSAPFFGNPVGIDRKTHLCAYDNAVLSIGNNVGISGSVIVAHKGVIIEDDVLIGGGTQIFDTDFHSLLFSERQENTVPDGKEVIIRKGVFIGANSIVLKGITIGARSVIGAGSVVVKDIPDDEVWGGNPARFIKKIENSGS